MDNTNTVTKQEVFKEHKESTSDIKEPVKEPEEPTNDLHKPEQGNDNNEPSFNMGKSELDTLYQLSREGMKEKSPQLGTKTNAAFWKLLSDIEGLLESEEDGRFYLGLEEMRIIFSLSKSGLSATTHNLNTHTNAVCWTLLDSIEQMLSKSQKKD